MSDYVSEISKFIEHGSSQTDPETYVTDLIDKIPAKQVGRVISSAARRIPLYPLGRIVLTLLKNRLNRDDELFDELSGFLTLQTATLDLRTVLLAILGGCSRHDQGRQELLFRRLGQIADSDRQPVGLRVLALHAQKPDVTPEVTALLGKFLKSGSPALVDGAASVVASWSSDGHSVPAELTTALVEIAKASPAKALKSSGVMMALATLKTRAATRVLKDLVNQVRTAEEQASILGAAGNLLSDYLLSRLIRQVIDTGDDNASQVLRAIFVDDPGRLASLYRAGHLHEYLYGLVLAADLIGAIEAKHLLELRRHSDRAISQLAQRAILLAPAHAELAHLQSRAGQLDSRAAQMTPAQLLELDSLLVKSQSLLETMYPPDQGKVEGGYNTGYHKADAIYRDLGYLQYMGIQNHWHAFLYQGFEVLNGTHVGVMKALQNDGNKMRFDLASASFPANSSVREKMQQLQDDFHARLQEAGVGSPYPLHGGHRTPGLSAGIAEQIAGTGELMGQKGSAIGYTFINMLDHKGNTWNGTINDIQRVRCDGVVEFCYEKNGQRVSSGIDSSEWNISRAGNRFLDNHNSFHTWFYDDGELCPRIQAGDHSDPNDTHSAAPADATRMTTDEGPELPQVADFYVNPQAWFLAPMIGFRIEAARYNHVYVRLTVSRNGGPFHFVRTEDPYGGEDAEVADWQFVKVHTGRDIVGWWLGKTVTGPNHAFESGPFEFRIVAVDLAGNVSELRRVTVQEIWP